MDAAAPEFSTLAVSSASPARRVQARFADVKPSRARVGPSAAPHKAARARGTDGTPAPEFAASVAGVDRSPARPGESYGADVPRRLRSIDGAG
jgi:hypothetical protein